MAKSKYESHVKPKLFLIECWARDGLTDEQIAKKLCIGKTTLYKYIDEHSELSERLKKGKEVVDYKVENALLKRALGYEYTEEKVEVEQASSGAEKVEVEQASSGAVISRKVIQTVKQVVPDTTAQIFWLKNRKPDKWRDKPPEKNGDDDNENDNLFDAIGEAVKNREV